MTEQKISAYQKELFEKFGFNFGFVTDLFEKYIEDPGSVTEYWRSYFDDFTRKEKSNKTASAEEHPGMAVIPQREHPVIELNKEDMPVVISGVGAKIIENMQSSLSIPTATSLRTISVKLLEENRLIINRHLKKLNIPKLSFTHIVAYAVVRALKKYPVMNNSFAIVDGKSNLIKKPYINLGLAVDTQRKDGSRSLVVPNIKKAGLMNFKQFMEAYNKLIEKVRSNQIEPMDFQGTTITLTNPGGIGTVSSTPRLMTGQGCIIAIGSIDYPSEFKAMQAGALASLGVGKVMNITSTYDHRIIQGAESGEFLALVDRLLLGEENFYENIFADLSISQKPVYWGIDTIGSIGFGMGHDVEYVKKQAILLQLINMFRVRGHLVANLNPLSHSPVYYSEIDPGYYGFTIWDYDRSFFTGTIKGLERATLREILELLNQTYCEKIGVEFMHIQNPEEKSWLQEMMEPVRNTPSFPDEMKKHILEKLVTAEGFEHFLHTKFIGHKRFSLEGLEVLIPVLDYILTRAADSGVEETVLGMAHRGRLNVLSNILGKSYEKIFTQFEDYVDPDFPQGTGDVKYHLGAAGNYKTFFDKEIKLTLAPNPSHLEFVNPVVEGMVRAKQTRNGDTKRHKILPLLIHGDAAFAGQGVVAETLNLSQLKGYRTGGTVHIIANNQIGFTTPPEDARSSPYATDVAKMVQSPIFHVNADDPESALWIAGLALEYRQKFNKDVVIDLIGYRRHGHNEGDDPVYTQPLMYKAIGEHPSVKEIYSEKLINEKIIDRKHFEEMDKAIFERLESALVTIKNKPEIFKPDRPLAYNAEYYNSKTIMKNSTSVEFEQLEKVVRGITSFDENFSLNPKLKKHIEKRKELLNGDAKIDWAFGEALAFGTLLLEGVPIRLSGQDSARGTFSQRHLIFTDINTEREIIPHNSITENQAVIEPLDSLLSEAAVLGYEFGYSSVDPLALVLWEAQFGDFANGAQVIIDNFIVSSNRKWELPNNLVMLLPHGHEGQGAEHSSARIERFLVLCAQDNIFICNPTTPAQYFHLLRRQIWHRMEKPLVVFTPKSLLRLPAARSDVKDFTDGKFLEVIDDALADKNKVRRIILTSGKLYYDLIKKRESIADSSTAIVRLEQYYPYPQNMIDEVLSSYPNALSVNWVQEEPRNMGAWGFLFPKLNEQIKTGQKLNYVGRVESPSPAPGSTKVHLQTQEELINKAFIL